MALRETSTGKPCHSKKEKGYLEFGKILNPHIISDGSHNNSSSVLTAGHPHLTDLVAMEAK